MAERRMFAKTILDSDAFLDMPLSTQALYMHLSMRADDEGFINNPKKIARMIGASEDDIKLLIAKHFIIPFDSGIVVIKHWRIHNYIRGDRLKGTVYLEERAMLEVKDNESYTLCQSNVSQVADTCQADDGQVTGKCQHRLGKDSIGKYSIGKDIYIGPATEIIEYLNTKTKQHYKATSEATRKHINARLNEGFSVEDFKTVIDKKTDEWLNDEKMSKYLRPETLFGTKFENYLNAPKADNGLHHSFDADELFNEAVERAKRELL